MKFLDAIPVVGHVKGTVHYLKGEKEAGDRAMKESTRSSVIMSAGAVGFVGGPAGSVALSSATGFLWDSVETLVTDQPTGVVAGIDNIFEDTSKGKIPVKGILQTSLTVTGDVLGGLTGASLASSITQATGQVATNMVEQSVTQTVSDSVSKSMGEVAGKNILKTASVPIGETFSKTIAKDAGKSLAKTMILEETTINMARLGASRSLINKAEEMLKTPSSRSYSSQIPRNQTINYQSKLQSESNVIPVKEFGKETTRKELAQLSSMVLSTGAVKSIKPAISASAMSQDMKTTITAYKFVQNSHDTNFNYHHWLDSIPVIGHVKSIVHYITGYTETGNRAIKESTRSSFVISAGALGLNNGLACSLALGAATGIIWDSLESIAIGQVTGTIKGFKKIFKTALNGEISVSAILQTTLIMTGDMAGGWCGNCLTNVIHDLDKTVLEIWSPTVLVSVVKSIIHEEAATITVHGITRAFVKEVLQNASSNNQSLPVSSSSSQQGSRHVVSSLLAPNDSSGASASGSGQQPPRQNITQPTHTQQDSLIQAFLNIFGEIERNIIIESLDQISIRKQYIFKNLNRYQKNYLKKIIKALIDRGNPKKIIKTVLNIFNTVDLQDVTFANFISLTEFIVQYLNERMIRQNEISQPHPEQSSYTSRRNSIVEIVSTQFLQYDYTILRVFQEIRTQIGCHILPISFRNIFAAVYHYFKHRFVGTQELSVAEYYALAQENLDIIMNTQEYIDFLSNGGEIEFVRYYVSYGRRLLIKIKKHGNRVDLSTCYFQDEPYEDHEDEHITINGRLL